MSLTPEILEQLRAEFPRERLRVKVQSVSKDRRRALLVPYLQHTDVTTRLDEVDPTWAGKIHRVDFAGDRCFVHMELTLLDVSRDNVGEGDDPKSAASDALKRCATLFGVGRYLYDQPKVRVDYDEDRDRYRTWTIEDFEAAIGARGEPVTPSSKPSRTPGPSPVAPLGNSRRVVSTGRIPPKKQLIAEIDHLQKLLKYSESDLISWARDHAGVSPDKMDVGQLNSFVAELQFEARKAGHRV